MSPVVKTRSAGFTLIELMVVVFIIGVLVAGTLTIIPKVQRAVRGAQTSAQLSALAAAIQQYYADYKSYPGPLPNNQICAGYDSSATQIVPFSSSAGPTFTLAGPGAGPFLDPQYNPGTGFLPKNITGAQNLVLGLLGGLEMVLQTDGTFKFEYHADDIFSDGVSPAPRGPASLNTTSPRRQQAYIQVSKGDISTPNIAYSSGTQASFADEAARSPGDAINGGVKTDAMIPVFLDKYSDPLPILYYRTNVGGTAIVGFRNEPTLNGTAGLVDNTPGADATPQTAQYDLLQNLPYTTCRIGTQGTLTDHPNSFHGLENLGTQANLSDPIDTKINGLYVPFNTGTSPSNAIAYFKDPTLNPPYDSSVTYPPCNTHMGVARQKDGFMLISAGADRLYGTHDDLVFPGPLLPNQ